MRTEKETKFRRVMAIIAIVLLLSLYGILFVMALFDTSESMRYFMIALFASIVVPIMLAWFLWMYRIRHRGDEDETEKET